MTRQKTTVIKSVILLMGIIFSRPCLSWGDGMIVIPPTPSIPVVRQTPFPLEVKYHHVSTQITNQVATTKIDQEFYNPTSARLEGYYIFPIPKSAVIQKFSLFINGTETPAELLDADKAKSIYEDIVRRQIDPALLEYYGLGLFKARIFPIEPRSYKRVKIIYHELLEKNNQTYFYKYPLNTEKFSAKPLNSISIHIDVTTDQRLKSIYSTTHDIDIARKSGYHAKISYEASQVKPNEDFHLYIGTDNSNWGASLIDYNTPGEDGYFLLNVSPDFDIESRYVDPKDIVFVLDNSGSMAGKKLRKAKKALAFCINNLNADDRFDIIRFSTEAEALFNALTQVNRHTLQQAEKYINTLKAIGGTNIENALEMALGKNTHGHRQFLIIFITDGRPTIGKTDENQLLSLVKKKNIQNTRIFTFGIGEEINTHLLDKLTTLTNAYRTYITPKEDIEIKISDFYIKVRSPVLTNIDLEFSPHFTVHKTYPKRLPDLFKGSSLSLLGRYKGEGMGWLHLKGFLKGQRQTYKFKIFFDRTNIKNDSIPPLWAARRIGYLLDQIRLNGEDKELVNEIVYLAKNYGIITPYTSYLVMEDEIHQIRNHNIRPEHRILSDIVKSDRSLQERNRAEYEAIKQKSGKGSIRSSTEIQSLSKSKNKNQAYQGKNRLYYSDKKGRTKNLSQQTKYLQGRALYNTGDYWFDSRIHTMKSAKTIRIQFASQKYFDFIRQHPHVAEILALGRQVQFVYDNNIYDIHE